jgi:hypothetical protein
MAQQLLHDSGAASYCFESLLRHPLRRSQGALPKSRLSSEGALGEQDRGGLSRGGQTDSAVAGCQGLESAPQSQRRSNMYITNTAERATIIHSIASTTNGIAPNNIALVALRKPFAPFLCSLRCRRAHTPNGLALDLSCELLRTLSRRTSQNVSSRHSGE